MLHLEINVKRRHIYALVAAVALIVTILPVSSWAAHQFTDVPDSNVFHDDIGWLADNGITLGCNPPTNDEFCPGDNVRRETMAAFMRRLAVNQVVDAKTAIDAENADDADMLDGIDSTDFALGNDVYTKTEVDAMLVPMLATIASSGDVWEADSRLVSSSRLSEGTYDVQFDRTVDGCAAVTTDIVFATVRDVSAEPGFSAPDTVRVVVRNAAGTLQDTWFSIIVMCPPAGTASATGGDGPNS